MLFTLYLSDYFFTDLLIPLLILLLLFQIKKFAECLDPNANGKISFKDFCHGVFAIKGNSVRLSLHFHPFSEQCCFLWSYYQGIRLSGYYPCVKDSHCTQCLLQSWNFKDAKRKNVVNINKCVFYSQAVWFSCVLTTNRGVSCWPRNLFHSFVFLCFRLVFASTWDFC